MEEPACSTPPSAFLEDRLVSKADSHHKSGDQPESNTTAYLIRAVRGLQLESNWVTGEQHHDAALDHPEAMFVYDECRIQQPCQRRYPSRGRFDRVLGGVPEGRRGQQRHAR